MVYKPCRLFKLLLPREADKRSLRSNTTSLFRQIRGTQVERVAGDGEDADALMLVAPRRMQARRGEREREREMWQFNVVKVSQVNPA